MQRSDHTSLFTFNPRRVSHRLVLAAACVALLTALGCGGGSGLSTSQSPDADLSASPTSGSAPLEVTLDATGSSDPDGSITRYDWDWDGDGDYELTSGGANPFHTYQSTGTFSTTVRVIDNNGSNSTATIQIQVN